jgi:DNA helicase-2/ATP-dependent DNA helicase PcrA
MRRLVLTRAHRRDVRGKSLISIPSQFLVEFSPHQVAEADDAAFGWDRVENESQEIPDDASGEQFVETGAVEQATGNEGQASGRPILTTGAELLNGTRRATEVPVGFTVGMSVRHPRYGLGTVVSVDGFSKRRTVTVAFEEPDHKETFVADKCPLQPVGLRKG